MTKIYHCIKDEKMEDFRNKDPANGYAYHVTNIDCCGRTELDMKKINWIRNRVDERVERIKSILSGESQPNQEEELTDQLAAINLNEELRPFEIRNSTYHPAVEGVEGVFMNTTLYSHQKDQKSVSKDIPLYLPPTTVYPSGDHYYQRISIKFDEISAKYPKCKFWCEKTFKNTTQRHYICYNSDMEIEKFKKPNSASGGIIFTEDIKDWNELGIEKEGGATKDILPRLQNDYNLKKYFNNIVLLGGIDIPKAPGDRGKIDIVKKSKFPPKPSNQ